MKCREIFRYRGWAWNKTPQQSNSRFNLWISLFGKGCRFGVQAWIGEVAYGEFSYRKAPNIILGFWPVEVNFWFIL